MRLTLRLIKRDNKMLSLWNQVLDQVEHQAPVVCAYIRGSKDYPDIKGMLLIYRLGNQSLVAVTVKGLPKEGFLGFHIHEGKACTGNEQDPLSNVGAHYNPGKEEHPNHAGDLPPLLSNHGTALLFFLTDRFTPEEVVGKTVIIHSMADDFHSQPSGNSGMKLACGQIMSNS